MRSPRFPLALKLALAFGATILLSVGLVYWITAESLDRQFDIYREANRTQYAERIATTLTNYYASNLSWARVLELFTRPIRITIGDQVIEGRQLTITEPLKLADENGRIFITTVDSEFLGQQLTEEEREMGQPIYYEDQVVATLVVLGVGGDLAREESEFLASAQRSALIGGGIAIVAATLLSTLVIVQILRPLRKLTRATERIAEGDLPSEVRLTSRDEYGQLGDSFNHMIDNLRRSEQVRQTMTADIAHEIRTPVTIIQGTLEAILDGVYSASNDTIVPIYEETLHLGRLIDDLRDLAMAEAGELRLDSEPTDLGMLIRSVVDVVIAPLESAPDIRVEAEPDLPLVPVDPMRIRQVIVNLLSNALRHTPSQGRIDISVSSGSDGVEIEVADSGTGIDPDDLEHLFERLYRGDPARNRAGGSGLGLAIVRQYVEAHGGTIHAANRPSGGARFVVTLPRG